MRRLFSKLLFLAILPVLFAGCATPRHVPMHQDTPSKIQSTDVIIGLNQEEIYAEIEQSRISQGTGGGLLFALVDSAVESSRSKKAEAFVAPVRNAMIGFSCGAELQKTMQKELEKMPWLHLRTVKQEHPYNEKLMEKILQESSSTLLLIMNTKYYLTPDFTELKLTAEVSGYAVSSDLKALALQLNAANTDPPVLYRNQLTVSYPLRGEFSEKQLAAEAWCADSGKTIRSAMTEVIGETARLLALDLEAARAEVRAKAQEGATVRTVSYDRQSGAVVAETPGRVVFRAKSGELYSAPKDVIE